MDAEGSADPAIVSTLIVDIDNTLYDWVSYFVPALDAMIDKAAEILGVEPDRLRGELRDVHRAHQNTELPFALLGTRTVLARYPDRSRAERLAVLADAFASFDAVRDAKLTLYPGVAETLTAIKATGCRLVGYTEASDVNVAKRLRLLGLREWLDPVYAPEYGGDPHPRHERDGPDPNRERYGIRRLPVGTQKSDPGIVEQIIDELEITPSRCAYVGDSLERDVAKAKAAGLIAVYAAYGRTDDPALQARLDQVSHREAPVPGDPSRAVLDVEPDVTLNSFAELWNIFTFAAP